MGFVTVQRLYRQALDNTDGALHLSDTPGLGLEMNMDYLSKNRVK
ncbi:MAG: hypothetical protein CM1200mP39_19160 [Dehalococcoidia bacterium]|nr:MAG: hypothetical protein CM1200mP39_19160 [Dehalococcoidia bacterium]